MRALTAALITAFATPATANLFNVGSTRGSLYELSVSSFTEVAPGYLATTLSITNISGNDSFDVNSVDISLGTNGSLHNEQAFGGFGKTATIGDAKALPGFTNASLDSHFLPAPSLALAGPDEGEISLVTDVGSTLNGGISGFGAELTGNFGFASATKVDLAYLVFGGPLGNRSFDYSVFANDGDPSSAGERFVGSLIFSPAPEVRCDLCNDDPFLDARASLSLQPVIDDGSYVLPEAIVVTAYGGPYFGLMSEIMDDVYDVFTVVESRTGVFDVGIDDERMRQLPFGTRLEARLRISTPARNDQTFLLRAMAVPEPRGFSTVLALAVVAFTRRREAARHRRRYA